MNPSFLPDMFALSMLVAILLLVRRKYSDVRTNAWLAGLFITLVESVTQAFYLPEAVPFAVLHVVIVDCYLLAGFVFVWASSDGLLSRELRIRYLVLNGLPLLVLGTTYGMNVKGAVPYVPAVVLGGVLGAVTSIVIYRSRLFAGLQVAGWSAAAILIHDGLARNAVYWAIAAVYAVAALNFYRQLERGNTGRLAIVTGFSAWAIFFFLHPWLAFHHGLLEIAAHFWNLQKSLISLGMILVLLERKASTETYLAHHDELTGLPNRRMFAARLSSAVDLASRRNSSLALIMLDLDGFKAINDSEGHQAGDFVLREVAALLRANVRATDTVARMGGDEFIILADGLTSDLSAWRLAESVRTAVGGPMYFQGAPLNVSASVGLALYPEDASDPIKLLRIADQRMYGRKKMPTSIRPKEASRVALPSA